MKRSLVTGGHGSSPRTWPGRCSSVATRSRCSTCRCRSSPGSPCSRSRRRSSWSRPTSATRGGSAHARAGEFDAVFHLAAQTLVGPALADPAPPSRPTCTAPGSCSRPAAADVPAVVVASSDKAYGPSEVSALREELGSARLSGTGRARPRPSAIALSYRPAYGLPAAVTRFANIYGGGGPQLLPAGSGGGRHGARRPPPPDPLRRHPRARLPPRRRRGRRLPRGRAAAGAGGPGAGEAFNAGGERPHSVAEVLGPIADACGARGRARIPGHGSPAGRSTASTSTRRSCGADRWARGRARDGLGRTLEWYRDNPEPTRLRS